MAIPWSSLKEGVSYENQLVVETETLQLLSAHQLEPHLFFLANILVCLISAEEK